MLITSLTLKHCRRLLLSNITEITLRPKEKMQLILGTNGSGKSSLLRELSPLPALKQDYLPGGYKIITLEANGKHYTLTSDFSKGAKYSFIENAIELNIAGIASTQKTLVEQHFKLDTHLHELLMGSVRFTEMSIQERRYWLTRISNMDYDYALGVYNRLKEKLRDASGVVKYNQNRLAKEAKESPSDETKLAMQTAMQATKDTLDAFIAFKHQSQDATALKHSLDQMDAKLIVASKAIIATKQFLRKQQPIDAVNLQNDIAANRANYAAKAEQLTASKAKLHELSQHGEHSKQDLLKEKETLLAAIQAAGASLQYPAIAISATNVNLLQSLTDALEGILSELPINDDIAINTVSHERLLASLATLQNQYNSLRNQHESLRQQVIRCDSLLAATPLVCPSCSHDWHEGYDKEHHASLLKQLDSTTANMANLKPAILETESNISNSALLLSKYNEYFQLVKRYQQFNALWLHIKEENWLYQQPKQIIRFLRSYQLDLTTRSEIDAALIKLARIDDHIAFLNKTSELDRASLANDTMRLEHTLLGLQTNYQLLLNDLKQAQLVTKKQQELDSALDQLKAALKQREQLTIALTNAKCQSTLNEYIQQTKAKLAEQEIAFNLAISKYQLVKDIEYQLASQQQAYGDLKLLVDAMSPVDGLIAESLLGFTRGFMNNINRIIESVWLYPMAIELPSLNNEKPELDYRFSIKINNEHVVSDVSKASSAMREIINLAFLLSTMKQLGLTDYPIYLDEFGHAMDTAHRKAAYNAISTLIAASDFSQIFLISHYEDLYGAIKNADLTVLCEQNINIPADLEPNRQTQIKR